MHRSLRLSAGGTRAPSWRSTLSAKTELTSPSASEPTSPSGSLQSRLEMTTQVHNHRQEPTGAAALWRQRHAPEPTRAPKMNPLWLARNLARSWANRSSVSDFARRMAWIYSAKLPRFARRHHWDIAFRYPAPIGEIRLRVRDNSGADAFIHSEVFEQEAYKFEQVTSPSTILDLGANAGYSTIYFSTYPAAAVACVEPIHANVAVLSEETSR